ncbi:sigma-54 dependent transcriptional regulator [Myxococcota bacterium]|nr:sigma-54 dependent transcriptional regulator [Myxococcota bacterium]
MITVLVADDDKTNLLLLKIFCRDRGDIRLEFASDGQEALERVKSGEIDILITDIRMPVLSGDELLTTVKTSFPLIPVIIMTGYGSIEGAVDYLHRGADDYLTKPLTKEVFIHRLERVMERVSLAKEVARLREAAQSPTTLQLIGRSPRMVELKNQLATVAQTEASVVIYGESGTGKEVVAHTVHSLSRRADRPFVTVNCGALPETLLESELFGYRKGAFTDARADTPGLVDAAHTGTLFLDEIGEISLNVQVKLLRFLELKEYKPLGSPKSKIADVRIIAATNRDLKRAVAEKTFREDLYYRLNIVPLELPPLRDRPGDIALLAAHFLERTNRAFNKNVSIPSPKVFRKLEAYPWPGNIRELENKIEQLVVMATDGIIRPDDVQLGVELTAEPRMPTGPIDGMPHPLAVAAPSVRTRRTFKEEKEALLRSFEREYVMAVLADAGGHVTRAAEKAGLDRKNLWQLMKRHDLRSEDFKRRGVDGEPDELDAEPA